MTGLVGLRDFSIKIRVHTHKGYLRRPVANRYQITKYVKLKLRKLESDNNDQKSLLDSFSASMAAGL